MDFEQQATYQQFCNCGRIVFYGEYIEEDQLQETNPQVSSLILSNFNSIFVSKPGQIVVKKLSDVNIVQNNTNIFDIYCHKCKEGFRLIIGREFCYSCPLEDCLMQQNQSKGKLLKRSLSSFFPLLLRRFIIEKAPEAVQKNISTAQSEYCPTFNIHKCLDDMDDDADFDMMFSANQNSIVGSFTDQWILNPELL